MAETVDNVDLEASTISTYCSFGRKLRSGGKFTSSLLHNPHDGTLQQSFDDGDVDGIEEVDERFVRSPPMRMESDEFSGTIHPEINNSVQDFENVQRRQRKTQNPKSSVNDPSASKSPGSVLLKNIFPNPGKEFDIYEAFPGHHVVLAEESFNETRVVNETIYSDEPDSGISVPNSTTVVQTSQKTDTELNVFEVNQRKKALITNGIPVKHQKTKMDSKSGPLTSKPHRGVHKTKCPIKCYFCNKKFSWKSNLNEHLKTHTGEKYFKCEICSKDFDRKGHLKTHVETVHGGLRPHACPSCPMEFGSNGALKRHVETVHEGLRPHACPFCPKEFSEKSVLKRHVASVHEGLRPHACPFCPKEYSRKVNLVMHLYSVHPKSDQSKK